MKFSQRDGLICARNMEYMVYNVRYLHEVHVTLEEDEGKRMESGADTRQKGHKQNS